jgi:hypothetical protein
MNQLIPLHVTPDIILKHTLEWEEEILRVSEKQLTPERDK